MQRVCGCIWAVEYLAQMMLIAISETTHTPPTKEPAISESCCPSSDLYSSANMHRHTKEVIRICFYTIMHTIHTHKHCGDV